MRDTPDRSLRRRCGDFLERPAQGILVCSCCEDFYLAVVFDDGGEGLVVGLHCRTCHTTIPLRRGRLTRQPRLNDDLHSFLLWQEQSEQKARLESELPDSRQLPLSISPK